MIFHWDMAIYRCSKWRPSAILELFTTIRDHPQSLYCWPQLPVKFHVNLIHRSEDIAIWFFLHIWLEMPIQAPKIGFLGDFRPLKVIIHHRDHQKAHPCINPRLLSYQLLKKCWGVWPRRVDRKCDGHTDTHRDTGKFIFCPCIGLDRQKYKQSL